MSAEHPTVIIKTPVPHSPGQMIAPYKTDIKLSDGSAFPAAVSRIDVSIDWQSGVPVLVDMKLVGGVALDMAAGIRFLEIDGQKYKLVKVEP